jgi:predicted flap endonuclease-1-like 5' DNA nuclease
MTELLWQTTFLLALAFFCGAVLACALKRRFYYGPPQKTAGAAASIAPAAASIPGASQPKIEVASRPAPEGQRFERALSGTAKASAAPAPSPTPAAAAVPPRAEAPAQLVVPPTNVRVEPVKAPSPAPAQPEVKPGIPRVSVTAGSGAPVKAEEGGGGPSDDLTRIRGIDPILQGRLKELGVRRFKDLAGFTPRDVKGLSEALGLDARISLENWIGQAQILATGGETYYSRRMDRGIPMPETAEPAAPAPAAVASPAPAPIASASEPALALAPTPAPAPAPPAASSGPAAPATDVAHLRSVRSEALLGEEAARATSMRSLNDVDDLKRIRGIGVLIEKKLNSLGITNYEQVANWTGADIERISRILDFKGRIERENWIEQARILATGGQTEFSRRS